MVIGGGDIVFEKIENAVIAITWRSGDTLDRDEPALIRHASHDTFSRKREKGAPHRCGNR
jgi:hypothetical protein